MNFFSLVKKVKPILEMATEEDSSSLDSGSLLSKFVSPEIYVPSIAIALPTTAALINEIDLPKVKSKSLDKLSEIVDALTGTNSKPTIPDKIPVKSNTESLTASSSAPLEIKEGVGKQSGLHRMTPSELGLSGRLPDKGIYTKEEADTILSLKSSGTDTSGSKTKIHPKIEELIRTKAAEYGINQDIAVKIAVVESGGNPSAISSTGAIGIFQFTGATANLMGLSNRFNILDNIDAGIRLLAADTKFVGSFNSDVATYLALQIGGPNAKYVLTSDRETKISELPTRIQQAIRGNLGGKSSTVGGDIEANRTALEEKITAQKSKPVYTPNVPVASSNTAQAPTGTLISSVVQPINKAVPAATALSSVASKPAPVQAYSQITPTPTSTSVVKEDTPTTVKPNYTKPIPQANDKVQVSSDVSSPGKDKQPSPTLDGVVRHKSGLYFNVV